VFSLNGLQRAEYFNLFADLLCFRHPILVKCLLVAYTAAATSHRHLKLDLDSICNSLKAIPFRFLFVELSGIVLLSMNGFRSLHNHILKLVLK
jgi:hypothetical protein